jgi:glycosyltransferase 2 family protein
VGKYARIGLGVVVTLVFLWLAVRNIEYSAVAEALRSANYLYLIPAALCTMAGFCLRAVRWGRILRPTRSVPFRRLFPVMMVGFAANNILPARIGEFARAFLTGSREQISRSLALATIVVERVFDGVTLIALMTITLVLFPRSLDNSTLQTVVFGATAIFGIATLGLIGLLVVPNVVLAPVFFVLRRVPRRIGSRVGGLIETFLQGLHALRSRSALGVISAYSVLIWALECSAFGFVLLAFPFDLSVPEWLAASAFLVVFVNLGIMVPSVPGYIGTYQFFATLALGAFAISSSYAFGLAIVAHAMQYVLITGTGLVCLSRMGLSPGGLSRIAPESQELESLPTLDTDKRRSLAR